MKTDYIELYTDYLISSNGKATAAGMSEMMDNAISHDQITRFLSKNEFDSKELWLKVKETVREIKSQDACLIEGSVGVLNLVCSDTALDGDSVSTLYEKRWKVEEFYKSLKHNVDLATSPTKAIRTQSNHIFLSILAFFKLEVLKIKHKINHFALRAKLLIKANQMAYQELLLLRGV